MNSSGLLTQSKLYTKLGASYLAGSKITDHLEAANVTTTALDRSAFANAKNIQTQRTARTTQAIANGVGTGEETESSDVLRYKARVLLHQGA